jgi:ABC-type cobalamin/Fe3+-siderophores transport system ATPase subunit
MRLQANGIRVRYGTRMAVDGVSLTAEPGFVTAILGANGSAKSSLLRALAGVQPCAGTVSWQDAGGSGGVEVELLDGPDGQPVIVPTRRISD